METRNLDSSGFEAGFTAYSVGNEQAMEIAERRFRPEYQVAFDAWLATDPENNPDAPKGPQYMEEYELPKAERGRRARREGRRALPGGRGGRRDRPTTTCAPPCSSPRSFSSSASAGTSACGWRCIGLVATGGAILVLSVVLLATSPIPP